MTGETGSYRYMAPEVFKSELCKKSPKRKICNSSMSISHSIYNTTFAVTYTYTFMQVFNPCTSPSCAENFQAPPPPLPPPPFSLPQASSDDSQCGK